MGTLHGPWLELAVVIPLGGAVWASALRRPEKAQWLSLSFAGAALACALLAWSDFSRTNSFEAHDASRFVDAWLGFDPFVIDELNAPLLPLAALVSVLTALATLRTKVRRFSFASALVSQSIVMATLACSDPRLIAGLLSAGTIPLLLEYRARVRPLRVYLLHMLLFVVATVIGMWLVEISPNESLARRAGIGLLLVGVFVRSGVVPFHCWVTDLFEQATLGSALLYITPMIGAYAAVRLVLPVAPEGVLWWLGLLSLVTAVYTGGMALVQRDARRFFSYILLSNQALVLAGLETASPLGVTAGLCVWLSASLSLAGFGLVLRALEARFGRLSLERFHGYYEHTPLLAVCFLLTGMASVGFPGSFGYLAAELLVDSAVETYPYAAVTVVAASAINGIAILQAYFALFTGARHIASVSLAPRLRETMTVLILAGLILTGGIYPQPGIASRYHAAIELLRRRGSFQNVPLLQSPSMGSSAGSGSASRW
jgi:NADH-quinone oxidoreductase subunit M